MTKKMFPINEPEGALACIQAICWLLRNQLLPRSTVHNHENVTIRKKFQKCMRKRIISTGLSVSLLAFLGLYIPQMLSTFSSALALETTDEEEIDWTEFNTILQIIVTTHNLSLPNCMK